MRRRLMRDVSSIVPVLPARRSWRDRRLFNTLGKIESRRQAQQRDDWREINGL
jgi:hypothetical protein